MYYLGYALYNYETLVRFLAETRIFLFSRTPRPVLIFLVHGYGYQEPYPHQKQPENEITTKLNPLSKIKLTGSHTLFSPYFSWCEQWIVNFYLSSASTFILNPLPQILADLKTTLQQLYSSFICAPLCKSPQHIFILPGSAKLHYFPCFLARYIVTYICQGTR